LSRIDAKSPSKRRIYRFGLHPQRRTGAVEEASRASDAAPKAPIAPQACVCKACRRTLERRVSLEANLLCHSNSGRATNDRLMKTSEIASTSPVEVGRRPPLAAAAFWIAIIIIMPEADLGAIAALQHHYAFAVFIGGVCFAIGVTPLLNELRRIRHEPSRWSGMGYLRAAGPVIIVNLVL
jgi:hypothetical protein